MMELKSIKGFENYKIDRNGNVFNRKGYKIKQSLNNRGYYCVWLQRGKKSYGRSVHSLVLNSFICKKPIGKECNHKNGIKTDNRLANLEWVTRSENLKHAISLGLREKCYFKNNDSAKGEDNPASRLKNGEIWLIKKLLYHKVIKSNFIAKMFKVTYHNISRIKLGKSWTHIEYHPNQT